MKRKRKNKKGECGCNEEKVKKIRRGNVVVTKRKRRNNRKTSSIS